MKQYKEQHQAYVGYFTWNSSTLKTVRMHGKIISFLFLITLIVFLYSFYRSFDYKTDVTIRYTIAKFMCQSGFPGARIKLPVDDHFISYRAFDIYENPIVQDVARAELSRLGWNFLQVFIAIFLLYPFIIKKFKNKSIEQSNKQYIRGARLDSKAEFFKQAKENEDKLDLPLGSVNQPRNAEPKHLIAIGSPGSGKTVAFSGILERLIERKEKGIIYDNKGDYLSKFYDPNRGDMIFNPLDPRSLNWNIFDEIQYSTDAQTIAQSLIPPPITQSEPFWQNGARSVFTGILHTLYTKGKRSNADIWDMVIADGKKICKDIAETEEGKAGRKFIENPESNQALGILAVLMEHTQCFQYMSKMGEGFSIRNWLNNDNQKGFIFITNYSDIQDTLRPILSLFIDLLARRLTSLKDDYYRRIFFKLDEFPTLQRMMAVVDLITLARSKGGCCYIGAQDYGQLDRLYTPNTRQTIMSGCGSHLYFNVSDQAAKIASDNIGQTEYIEFLKSSTIGNKYNPENLTPNKKKEPLFLPSDISNLKDLNGILKIRNYNFVKTKFTYKKFPEKHDPFRLRNDLLMENILKEQEEIKKMREDAENMAVEENVL